MATAAGIATVIGNGLVPGVLARAWAGEPRRHALRAAGGAPVQLQAVAQVRQAEPRHADASTRGAARALREGGTSLLPVGIVDVQGAFDAGDAVEVTTAPAAIGKGITNYSAAELRQVKGLKSAAGPRDAAARDRGGRPPRLLRARLMVDPAAARSTRADAPSDAGRRPHEREQCSAATRPLEAGGDPALRGAASDPWGRGGHPSRLWAWPPSSPRRLPPPPRPSPTSAAPPSARRARSRARLRHQGPRAARDRRRARGAHARDPRGQRARPRGGPRAGLSRRAARPPGARRARASPRSPTACARSSRCPIRSARCSTASGSPNGLDVRKVRVPLGVVAVVYEARPNVTIDAAALCLKSGNAIVLRGSSSATHSNAVLAARRRRGGEARRAARGRARAGRRRRARGARRARRRRRASST